MAAKTVRVCKTKLPVFCTQAGWTDGQTDRFQF